MTYLLTFNCYGTHVPGEIGWVDRTRGNHRGGYHEPSSGLARYSRRVMSQEMYSLDLARAKIVLDAIRETCRFRKWELLAAHVRTSHVHVVIDGFCGDPDSCVGDLKRYASRALHEAGREPRGRMLWARGGSTRSLRGAQAIDAAIKYVTNKQGEAIAVYWNDKNLEPPR